MDGMRAPGQGEWYKAQKNLSPEFHPDPIKEKEPAEDLLRQRGLEDAIAELEGRLNKNPQDTEALRQLNLIRNRLADLLTRVNKRIQH